MQTTELTEFGLGLRIENFSPDGSGARAASKQTIRDLLWEFGVLHFAGFPADSDVFVDFARWFGRPESVFPAEHRAPGYEHIRLQSNIRGYGVNAGGQYWHADGSFAEVPTAVTLLLCEEAPDHGGVTLFADMRAAYESLPEPLRTTVLGMAGHYPCRAIAARDMRAAVAMKTVTLSEADRKARLEGLRDFTRPLVGSHPVTDRRALYLNQHWLRGIEGRTDAESAELLDLLYGVATAPANLYRHTWRTGDVLVWDNASVMHRALPAQAGQRKVTRRITISGER
ncbi:TauD/TfdA dioxygenase family protein [Streptomyces sp. 7N604]|uniref:TauD/TfdA dioxygenase family protein n=1 Tax=Streptomyces sp. 7N604 TaxID=3457415 RepID=UPI003FD2612B